MHRIALVFMVLPLALAACSGTESRVALQLTPTASVRQAANKTTAATSAHLTFNASGAFDGQNGSLTGTADFDNANHRGSFHLDVPEYGAVDVILDGNTAYFSAPFLKAFLPAGKTWLKLDGKTRSSALPKSLPQNPNQALARLKKLANVRKVGEETIDGVTTTHYHGVGRLDHGTFDVWIGNDDGYVRRVRAGANGKQGHGEVVVTLSDFGKPVSVTAPPASETADAGKLMSSFKTNFFKRG
jgi:LppX_LprAFG lipoprotein